MASDDLLGEDRSPQAVGRRGNVRIGLCSWSDPSLIKSKAFYPRGAGTPEGRLRFYAQNFPVVEVDSSFGIDGLVEKAFDVVVLLNVNHEDQGVRAARALERKQRQLLGQLGPP